MINQLMQIEASPQTRLKTKVSDAQSVVTSYQSINTKLSALKTAADDLSRLSTWRSIKPTSSSTAVTATATPGVTSTQTGNLTFNVVQLAKAQITTARVDSEAPITSNDAFTITMNDGSDPIVVELAGKRTAQGVADAINSADIGVKASLVKTSTGDSVLQLTGTKTGAVNGFVIDGVDFTTKNAVEAQDAMLQVGGTEETGGYSVTSSTNTFTSLMPGVTLTATKEETGVTVDVATDASGIADKIKAMVDAANAVLSEVTKQTKVDATGKGATLTGDFMVRQISQTVLSTVSQGQAGIGSLSKLGVQLEKDGMLSFKAGSFNSSYAADPAKFQAAGIAMGDAFQAVAKKQTDNLTAAITGRRNIIDSMNDQIDNWDTRLEARRSALTKQYASLETALSNLRSQSSYLSSQLG